MLFLELVEPLSLAVSRRTIVDHEKFEWDSQFIFKDIHGVGHNILPVVWWVVAGEDNT